MYTCISTSQGFNWKHNAGNFLTVNYFDFHNAECGQPSVPARVVPMLEGYTYPRPAAPYAAPRYPYPQTGAPFAASPYPYPRTEDKWCRPILFHSEGQEDTILHSSSLIGILAFTDLFICQSHNFNSRTSEPKCEFEFVSGM
ncbi:hypothetical protein TSUD_331400 [Trifolium subterraneum]|uniref:Uncharacterized protein n=1 Tax=Trifolium subterraneum TaxID=3900 RepID=A0A2Z6MD47_TRISU|nr:hypothetical protein TSUD_331400 [Trifolium subterraneum]